MDKISDPIDGGKYRSTSNDTIVEIDNTAAMTVIIGLGQARRFD